MLTEEWKKRSIYRVPAYMKDRNPRGYTPQCLSLGPYHHCSPHLAAMEIHKARAVRFFLDSSKKTYVDCLLVLGRLGEKRLMESYDQLDNEWKQNPQRFLELMLLDGVFLYLILRTYSGPLVEVEMIDPVFSVNALSKLGPYLLPDIVMLENQIPFAVIERLYALEKDQLYEQHDEKVRDLMFKAFCPHISSQTQIIMLKELRASMRRELHLLDAVGKMMCNTITSQPQSNNPSMEDATLTCSAMDLYWAGVRFECDETRGISFENRILKLPLWVINTSTEALLLNSIAFEFIHPATNYVDVSSYVAFMHGLIKSADDARLLASHGTIESEIGSGEAVADLIKRVSTDAFFDPS